MFEVQEFIAFEKTNAEYTSTKNKILSKKRRSGKGGRKK